MRKLIANKQPKLMDRLQHFAQMGLLNSDELSQLTGHTFSTGKAQSLPLEDLFKMKSSLYSNSSDPRLFTLYREASVPIETLHFYFASGLDPNKLWKQGSLLSWLCCTFRPVKPHIELALKHGANPNIIDYGDYFENTALFILIANEGYDLAAWFVEKTVACSGKQKLDLDYQDKQKKTALIFATKMRSPKLVKALILHGADVNRVDEDKRSALHYAAILGCKDSFEALIKADADRYLKDKDGKTAEDYLNMSVKQRKSCVFSVLLSVNINPDRAVGSIWNHVVGIDFVPIKEMSNSFFPKPIVATYANAQIMLQNPNSYRVTGDYACLNPKENAVFLSKELLAIKNQTMMNACLSGVKSVKEVLERHHRRYSDAVIEDKSVGQLNSEKSTYGGYGPNWMAKKRQDNTAIDALYPVKDKKEAIAVKRGLPQRYQSLPFVMVEIKKQRYLVLKDINRNAHQSVILSDN